MKLTKHSTLPLCRRDMRLAGRSTIVVLFHAVLLVVSLIMPPPAQARQIKLSDIIGLPAELPVAAIARDGVAFDRNVAPGLSQSFFTLPRATIRVKSYGAAGNGITDDTAALERALKAAKPGMLVWFDAGTYRTSRTLQIRTTGVVIAGSQATLHAARTDNSAIHVLADSVSLVGLRFTVGKTGSRGSLLQHHRIVITGKYNRIISNTIIGSKATGIFLFGARHALVAGNRVRSTRADGIHSTEGAAYNYIVSNEVHGSGDDGIAVVSYDKTTKAHDIVVERNFVHDLRWGRGLSVVGGDRVTVRGNTVRTIAAAAGIIVASEVAYQTPGSSMIYILDNKITDIQTSLAPLNGAQRAGHAAIEINAEDATSDNVVDRIVVRNNRVAISQFGGVRIMGGVCRVVLRDNSFTKVDDAPLTIVEPTCGNPLIACRGLKLDGRPWGNKLCRK